MFSLPELSRRLAATRAIVREERLDALAATELADVRWLMPAAAAGWSLIVPAVGDPALVASEQLASRLRDLGVDAGAIGVAGVGRDVLARALPGALLRDVGASLWRRRAIRSAEEIAVVRAAAARADDALRAAAHGHPPDGDDVAIVIARTAMRAPRSVDLDGALAAKQLERGDIGVVTVVAGPLGHRAHLARVFTAGEPPTPEFSRLHAAALATRRASVAAIKAGAKLRDCGEGASIAEGEALGPQSVLEAGMMVLVRAEAASGDGRARVRVADLHLVGADGAEPLQRFPLEIGRWR